MLAARGEDTPSISNFALHGHYKEARTALTSSGLLDVADDKIRTQIKELYATSTEQPATLQPMCG